MIIMSKLRGKRFVGVQSQSDMSVTKRLEDNEVDLQVAFSEPHSDEI